jgi:predicted RNA binding protein YcfA (HicA-like mRNA interferase family)
MASIVAKRLIARLERDGFVVMRKPPLGQGIQG